MNGTVPTNIHTPGWIDTFLSTSLEPPETKPRVPANLPGGCAGEEIGLSESFRHSGWAHGRQLVYASLKRTMQTVSRIVAFQDCGAFAFVYQTVHAPYEYRLGGSMCRDRFCVPCALQRSRTIATNVLETLSGEPARFLTLTLRSNDGSLTTQIDRLYSCFGALRRTQLWRSRVDGGCAFTEIKWSSRVQAWNVHVHCIIHGLFVPQNELSHAWWTITGDSFILDIRRITDKDCVGRYVTKYASKPLNNTFWNRESLLDEVVRAMVGRRLCFTFGTWRGVKLTQTPEPGDWINLGSFHDVLRQARDGDLEALRAVQYIAGQRTGDLLQAVETVPDPPKLQAPCPKQHTFDWAIPGLRF